MKALLVNRAANMDTLVALGTGTAYAYSLFSTVMIWISEGYSLDNLYFEVAALLLAFILLGKFFGSKGKGKDFRGNKEADEAAGKDCNCACERKRGSGAC